MSADRTGPPIAHDSRAETVSGGSVGVAHGAVTIINEATPPTPAKDTLRDIATAHVELAPPPEPGPVDREAPYPLFRPYDNPAIFAGRDADTAEIVRAVRGDLPIIGVFAPSGYGKSSLLLAGVGPALRSAWQPTVIERHPADPGLGARLLGELLCPAPSLADDQPEHFVAWLRRAVDLAERPPVLVLDQFEAVFKTGDDDTARARVALLVAATLGAGLPVRWVLSYRAEFDWQVGQWLEHAHEELARHFSAHAPSLPRLGAARMARCPVAPFGAEAPADAFREAIRRPLDHAGWTIQPGAVERLARPFAAARKAQWQWPLVPELQVVLERRRRAADDRHLTAPDDVETELGAALRGHIERVIDDLAAHYADPRIGRALIGVALRRLVDSRGRRDEVGLTRAELEHVIDGRTLDALEDRGARLLMADRDEASPGGRYTLSHDTLAAEIATLGDEGWFTELAEADREALRVVLALDGRIGSLAALYRDEGTDAALELADDDMALIERHAEQLLWDATRRTWWEAAVVHRRQRRRQRVIAGVVAAALVIGVAFGAWWTDRQARIEQAISRIEAGQAILRNMQDLLDLGYADDRLDALIDAAPLDAVETTPDEPVEPARARFVRRRLVGVSPAESAEDFGRLIAAVETGAHPETPGHIDAAARARLRADIRETLLVRFPGTTPEPAIEWVEVQGGTFAMGDERGEVVDELPVRQVMVPAFELGRAEVTIGQYRAFDPEGYARNLRGQRAVAANVARWGDRAAIYPARMVSWHEAWAFALWADPDGRLPTEAEWEFAARGGVDAPGEATKYWWGDDDAKATENAWIDRNSGGLPHPVCDPPQPPEPPHPLRLCDIAGNLYEWTASVYTDTGYPDGPATAPLGPRRGALRVHRGGCFLLGALVARSASRHGDPPGIRGPALGFRLARSAPSSSIER